MVDGTAAANAGNCRVWLITRLACTWLTIPCPCSPSSVLLIHQADLCAPRGTSLALVPELVHVESKGARETKGQPRESKGPQQPDAPHLVLHVLEYSAVHKAIMRRSPATNAATIHLAPAKRIEKARQANEVAAPVTAAAVTTRHDASLPSQLDHIVKAVILRNRIADSAAVPPGLTVLQPYLDADQLLSVAVHKNVLPHTDAADLTTSAVTAESGSSGEGTGAAKASAVAAVAAAGPAVAQSDPAAAPSTTTTQKLVVSRQTDVTKLAIAVVNEAVRAHASSAGSTDPPAEGSTGGTAPVLVLRAGYREGLQKAVAAVAMVQAQLRARTAGCSLVAVPAVVSQQDEKGKSFAVVELGLVLTDRVPIPGLPDMAPPGEEPGAAAPLDADVA